MSNKPPFIQFWKESGTWNVLIRTDAEFQDNKTPSSFFASHYKTKDEAISFIQGLRYNIIYQNMDIVEGTENEN